MARSGGGGHSVGSPRPMYLADRRRREPPAPPFRSPCPNVPGYRRLPSPKTSNTRTTFKAHRGRMRRGFPRPGTRLLSSAGMGHTTSFSPPRNPAQRLAAIARASQATVRKRHVCYFDGAHHPSRPMAAGGRALSYPSPTLRRLPSPNLDLKASFLCQSRQRPCTSPAGPTLPECTAGWIEWTGVDWSGFLAQSLFAKRSKATRTHAHAHTRTHD